MKTNISTFSHQEGETLGVAGGNYRIILSGDQTNHAYAVIEMLVPPGGGYHLIPIPIRKKCSI